MLRNKKAVVAIASAAALALGISGSGVANAAGATGKIEVFSWWTSGSESAALKAILDSLQKANPKLNIVNAAVAGGAGTNAKQVLATRLAANNTPETWQTQPGGELKGYVDQNVLKDQTALYKSQGWNKVVPKELIQSITFGGKVYSVATGVHRANVLWYNKKLVDAAGVKLGASTSWAQFSAAAGKIKDTGVAPICLGDKDIWTAAQLLEEMIVGELGGKAWNDLLTGKLKWSSSQVKTVVDHFNLAMTWTNTDHKALDWTGAVAALAQDKCAMMVMGDWAYGELLVKQGKKDGVDFGYTVIGDANTFVTVTDSFVIGKNAKNPKAAEEFLKAVMDPKVQLAFNKLKGSSPVRSDVKTSTLGKYQQGAARVLAKGTKVASLVHGQANVAASIGQAFADAVTVLQANQDAAAFGKTMDDAIAAAK